MKHRFETVLCESRIFVETFVWVFLFAVSEARDLNNRTDQVLAYRSALVPIPEAAWEVDLGQYGVHTVFYSMN